MSPTVGLRDLTARSQDSGARSLRLQTFGPSAVDAGTVPFASRGLRRNQRCSKDGFEYPHFRELPKAVFLKNMSCFLEKSLVHSESVQQLV